jgi:hypothetical protein
MGQVDANETASSRTKRLFFFRYLPNQILSGLFHIYMGEVTMVTFTKYEDWMILQVYH